MSSRRLVSVFGPGNVLAALSAVKWRESQRSEDTDWNVVTLVHTPGLPEPIARDSGVVVERLISSQGWPEPLVLTDADMEEVVKGGRFPRYREVLRRFRRKLGTEHFDEIYYAHDVVGRVPELAMNAYPDAKRITFGDALGSVYDKRYHIALAIGPRSVSGGGPLRRVRGVARRRLEEARTGILGFFLGAPRDLQAGTAMLILPMDQTGACLASMELFIVPKNLVRDIISQCNEAVPELTQYVRQLLIGAPVPRFVMLLENISDGHFMSFEREVALYEEMVRRNAPRGATLIVKEHPLSIAPVGEVLAKRLTPDYSVRRVSPEFHRYPLELWRGLVEACQVISMSYCTISLTYLYDKSVIYPMEMSLIEEYIPPRFWDSYKNADALYRGQLANLATWDGQSVLWRGSVP